MCEVLAEQRARRQTDIELLAPDPVVTAGVRTMMRVRLTNRSTGLPCTGLRDVVILIYTSAGWQTRPADV